MKKIFKFLGTLFLFVLSVSPVWAIPVQGVGVVRQNLVPFFPPATGFIETRHENFNTGHGWTKNFGNGTISDDSVVNINNENSMKVVTLGDSTGGFYRSPIISPALNLTDRNLLVRLRVDDSVSLSSLKIWVSSDNFATNNIQYQLLEIASLKSGNLPNEWLTISMSPEDVAGSSGTTDIAAINAFQFSVQDTGTPVTVNVGTIGSSPQQAKGKVVLMFDDTHDEGYTEAMKKMSEYGMVGSADINPSNVGTSGRMTVEQLRELQDVHGWEISLQVSGDITQHTGQGIEDFLNTGRKWLIDNNLTSGIQHYAYSGGFYNAESLKVIRKYFKTARNSGVGLNGSTYPPGDWHILQSQSIDTSDTTGFLAGLIDDAIAENELMIFTFHEIVATTTGGSQISIADFSTFIDDLHAHVVAGDIEVVTMDQAVGDLN